MKVFGVFPIVDIGGRDTPTEQTRKGIDIVTQLCFEALRHNGDRFHYVVNWRDPGDNGNKGTLTEGLAEPHVVQLESAEALRNQLLQSVDPNGPAGATIRSVATCRAATFGWDGQAFLLLRHEDPAPVSPDLSLVVVEERADILLNYDYFDGWLGD
jgi:hypothetical protein